MTEKLPNPHLANLAFLVGDWDTWISGASFLPAMDTVVHGRLEGRLIEDRRLLALRQITETSGAGSHVGDRARRRRNALHGALRRRERGVACLRHDVGEGHWSILRDDPHFSQCFDASVSTAADTITGEWKKKGPQGAWAHDLDLTCTRLAP